MWHYLTRYSTKSKNPGPRSLFILSLIYFAFTPVATCSVHGQGQGLEKLNRLAQSTNATDAASEAFRQGRDLIADEKWSAAAEKFNEVITRYSQSRYTDAALYWYAFALKKQAQYQRASATLEELIRKYPNSTWIDDARAMRVEIAPQLGRGQIIDQETASANDEIKLAALQSLFMTNPERASAFVLDLLKPGSTAGPRLKEGAVSLLGQQGDAKAINVLLELVRNESDLKLRKAATFWLGQSGDERALALLKELVSTAPDEELSKAALFAISQHDSPQAVQFLTETARAAKSVEVRKQAIFWLSQREGEQVIDELLTIYQADQEVEVKKQILFALSQINSPRAHEKLLEIARTGDSIPVRKQAIFWIGQEGGAEAVTLLIQLYDSEQNTEIKEQILFAISQSEEKAALRKLMDVAKTDASIEMRKKAIFWIGQSKDPEAMKFLEEILK